MRPDSTTLDATELHRPGNLQILDGVAIDLLESGKSRPREVFMMKQPIARFLIGVEQPLLGYFVGRTGRLGAGDAGGSEYGCEHGRPHEKSLPYKFCHGLFLLVTI
jgi:hypothetical protein